MRGCDVSRRNINVCNMFSVFTLTILSSVLCDFMVECMSVVMNVMLSLMSVQNLFLTAQSTQIKSVISVPIKDFIHHYPRALFNDIPRVGAYFYDIPGSGRTFTTYPGRGAV